MPSHEPVIEVTNLTKTFRAFRKKYTVVDNLTFDIERGDIFGLLGPNGSGKSTIIRMLAGILRPTYGTIKINGYDITKNPIDAKQKLGLMPETVGFYDNMNGAAVLRFFAKFYEPQIGRSTDLNARIRGLMDFVGLAPAEDKHVTLYSHGMRKRLALAIALVNDPEILILDEPTAGLDPSGVRIFKRLIKELHDRGTTIFMASHVLAVAEELCNRVGILNEGKLVAIDTVGNLRKRMMGKEPTLERVFMALTERKPCSH
jgi:ABC-2 type transport system ATP-binding protein